MRKDGSLRYRAGDIVESSSAKLPPATDDDPDASVATAATRAQAVPPEREEADIVLSEEEEVTIEDLPELPDAATAPAEVPPAVVRLADVTLMGDEMSGAVWALQRTTPPKPGRPRDPQSPFERSPGMGVERNDVTVERLENSDDEDAPQ